MRSERTGNPTTISAATLIAVVAMLSCASAATALQPIACEARPMDDDSRAVRAMAAAVAAVARDLLQADRTVVALPPLDRCGEPATTVVVLDRPVPRAFQPRRVLIPERLLDLPPPAC